MSVNLTDSVHRVVTDLDDMPLDQDVLDALIKGFDSVIPVMPYSAHETYQMGCKACSEVYDHAYAMETVGRGDFAEQLYCIAWRFRASLEIWYDCAYAAEKADRKNWDCGSVTAAYIARWESRGGKYWVELWRGGCDYSYRSDSGGGSVCRPDAPIEGAIAVMQSKLARGCFLPDCAKLPMKRIN